MKKKFLLITFFFTAFALTGFAQNKKSEMIKDARKAVQDFKKKDPSLSKFFNSAYGYVVFPHIGKGGIGIGGGGGKGVVFKDGTPVAGAKVTQITIGLQAGGQKYAEIVFFENKAAYDRFTGSKFEFSGEVSAVALKEGVSKSARYRDGMAVFTMAIGGLMYEASVGGQKFKVDFY